jgi:small-conductance mechanosensitive channel
MEQAIVNATEEFYKNQIAQKDERIQQLEQHVQRVTQRDYAGAGALSAMRDQMHNWTINELENSDITQQQAESIAEICGFELAKEVDVIVTVEYSMTLKVPAGEEVEDIIHDIDFEAITYDTDKITYITSCLNGVEF